MNVGVHHWLLFLLFVAIRHGFSRGISSLNGTGTVLATLDLPKTPEGRGAAPCNSTDDYCPWEPFGVNFSGTAMSVIFTGTANHIDFDNITLGSSTPMSGVPEPATGILVLAGIGLVRLAVMRRRKRADFR